MCMVMFTLGGIKSFIQWKFDCLIAQSLLATWNFVDALECCKLYCNQHWQDEILTSKLCAASSAHDLSIALMNSPFHNFLNPGLLKLFANTSRSKFLNCSVKIYEEFSNYVKLRDLMFREIKVTGASIPPHDYALVTSAILEHGITVGQLQKSCTPRCLHLYNSVILDFSIDVPDFYYSIKVNGKYV